MQSSCIWLCIRATRLPVGWPGSWRPCWDIIYLRLSCCRLLFSGVYVVLCSVLAESVWWQELCTSAGCNWRHFTPFSLRVFHLAWTGVLWFVFLDLVYYVIILYMNTEKDKYLIRLGIVFGLAVLNKYLIMLLLPALFIPFLLTSWRKVFFWIKPYISEWLWLCWSYCLISSGRWVISFRCPGI